MKSYQYTTESGLIDDVYDYLFLNHHNIGTSFIDEFSESYVDPIKCEIILQSKELGRFKIKLEKA